MGLVTAIRKDKLKKRRWIRAVGTFLGVSLSTAGPAAAAKLPWYVVLMSSVGAGITGAMAAINLGELNAPAPTSVPTSAVRSRVDPGAEP